MVVEKSSNNTAMANLKGGMITDGDYSHSTETVKYQMGRHAIGSTSQLTGNGHRPPKMRAVNSTETGITVIGKLRNINPNSIGNQERMKTQTSFMKAVGQPKPMHLNEDNSSSKLINYK